MDSPEFKDFLKQTEAYGQLIERIYKFPKGYISYHQLVNEISETILKDIMLAQFYASQESPANLNQGINEYFVKDRVNLYHYLNCLSFVAEKYPIFALSKSLASSLWVSDPPMYLQEIKPWAYGGVIVLPQGLIKSPTGIPIHWLIFRVTRSEVERFELVRNAFLDVRNPAIALHYSLIHEHEIYGSNFVLKEHQQYEVGRPLSKEYEKGELTEIEFDVATDGEFLTRLNNLMIQVCLYQQIYGKDNVPFHAAAAPKFSKKHKLSPIIIGENYQIKTEKLRKGHHASPHSHWRRGHFRNQPYGSRQSPQYRLTWIEPVFVN